MLGYQWMYNAFQLFDVVLQGLNAPNEQEVAEHLPCVAASMVPHCPPLKDPVKVDSQLHDSLER